MERLYVFFVTCRDVPWSVPTGGFIECEPFGL